MNQSNLSPSSNPPSQKKKEFNSKQPLKVVELSEKDSNFSSVPIMKNLGMPPKPPSLKNTQNFKKD